MSFAPGALVRAREREWVVLPESKDDLLVLRPLGGSDAEVAGIYLPLEKVESATFPPPSIEHLGDHTSCRLLRDAVRLGFRSSAGPFRSFAQLAVEPRPYQLVPLLMALKQDPVRLLIADDVGIGKTVEAGLIAREMLDRGEVKGMAVLCPPHLAEQWQVELRDKFHIETELVLASTATRLERNLGVGESLFEHYRNVVVSMDFIKGDRRRDDLALIPDEAFGVIEGDDKKVVSSLKRDNKAQRSGQGSLFGGNRVVASSEGLVSAAIALEAVVDETIDGVHKKERAWEDLRQSEASSVPTIRSCRGSGCPSSR